MHPPQVANGYRPPIAPHLNARVAGLIERCWKGLPELRPSMGAVLAELEAAQAEGECTR